MTPPPSDEGPLTGLRVLEVATLFAAPQVATMLADLGADVVKVEARGGDPLRSMGASAAGGSSAWELVGRNKRSIVLDLDRVDTEENGDETGDEHEDLATFRGLVRVADVLVENLPTPVRTRWGATYESLQELNPRLVVVSVSCYGRTGPYAERPGAGTLAEAFAGLTHMTGEADGPPMLASVAVGDTVTAFAGVIGALAACWSRDARGAEGRLVDVSMYEPVLAIMAGTIAGWAPGDPVPTRRGSRVAGGVPRNVYRTRDARYVAVSGTTDPQVARVLDVIGRTTADDVERFGSAGARRRHGDELDALVAAWIAEHDRDEVVEVLLDARVGVSPVNDVADVLADQHVAARGSLIATAREVTRAGSTVVPAPLPAMSGSRRALSPAPELDADRDAILREWLAE